MVYDGVLLVGVLEVEHVRGGVVVVVVVGVSGVVIVGRVVPLMVLTLTVMVLAA